MKEIKLTRGQVAIVDDEDYERISKHNWAVHPQRAGYAVRKGNKKRGEPRTILMHREVLNAPRDAQIDHINRNSLDNRKCNLRLATVQKNAFNRAKPNVKCTSRYKGVFQRKDQKSWSARIKHNDRHIELGRYKEEAYAAAVYNYAARILFGEFRCENEDALIPETLLQSDRSKIEMKCKAHLQLLSEQLSACNAFAGHMHEGLSQ